MGLLAVHCWAVEVVLCCLLSLAKVKVLVTVVEVLVLAGRVMETSETLDVALSGREISAGEMLSL
jgi:hypothetical protein